MVRGEEKVKGDEWKKAVSNHGSTVLFCFFFQSKNVDSLMLQEVCQTFVCFQGRLSICCSEDSLLCEH